MAIHLCGGCTTEHCNSGQACNTGTFSWAGRVLSRHERNGYDDSDFYALVWDDSTESVKSVDYASTRGWTYHNHAVIDAPAEIVALAAAYQRMVREAHDMEADRVEASVPAVGKEVKSLTTRGKNKGVRGIVRRVVEGTYGLQVAIEVAGENKYRYLSFDRVAVV